MEDLTTKYKQGYKRNYSRCSQLPKAPFFNLTSKDQTPNSGDLKAKKRVARQQPRLLAAQRRRSAVDQSINAFGTSFNCEINECGVGSIHAWATRATADRYRSRPTVMLFVETSVMSY